MNIQKTTNSISAIESNFIRILDFMPDLFFLLNFEGVIIDQRAGLTEDLYVPRETFLGKRMQEVLPPDVAQTFLSALTAISKNKKSILAIEYPLPLAHGVEYFEAKLKFFQNDQVIALIRNISDRKKIEKESLQSRESFEKLQHKTIEQQGTAKKIIRLDSYDYVGKLIASLGHEIKNPLTTIKGFLQLLQAKSKNNEEYFNIIFAELDAIHHTLTDFLSLAAKKAQAFTTGNINDVVADIGPLLKANAALHQQHIQIKLGHISDITLDKAQIRRLIVNLTNNGYEAMSAGGHLSLKTTASANHVNLIIKDEGHGISPELLSKIGTPFITTKKNGTGLGLAICCHIAAVHHALLAVESTADGTTFTIQFPINSTTATTKDNEEV